MEEDREVPGSKRRWKSIPRLRLRGVNSATRFCLFSKVRSAGLTAGNTPVYLNVYDLTPMNGYAYWAGFGIFHSGIEGTSYFCFKCCLEPLFNGVECYSNYLSYILWYLFFCSSTFSSRLRDL